MPSKSAIAMVLALAISIANAQETSLNVLELQNRPAEDLISSVQPLLEADERVIADGFKLIIKCRPERYSSIEQLVQQLDSQQNNLLISVIQNSSKSAQQLNAELGIGVSNRGIHMNGMMADTRETDARQQIQKIRTLDGQAAQIQTGSQRPIETINVYDNGYGYPGMSRQTQLQTASSGFVVVPQLVGNNNVVLDISPWSQQWQGGYGQQQQQSLHTTIRTQLGQWVELGNLGDTVQTRQNGMNGLNYETQNQQYHFLLKVDKSGQ